MSEMRISKHAVLAKAQPMKGELRKAVDAVYAYPHQGKLTLVARKAFNLMLAKAMEAGPEDEWYEISVTDLARDIRFDSKDMKYLENTLDAMQSTLLKWDVLEKIAGKDVRVRDSVQLLGAVRVIGGVSENGERIGIARTVKYQFDKRVKQRLLVPEVYARINLQLQSEFRSSYTLALYEQVIRYKGNVGNDGWAYTVKLAWREWRNLILGGDHAPIYEQYKYFSRDVLNKALSELNSVVSDFEFEVMVYKAGRNISELQFRLRIKAQRSLGLADTRPIIDTEAISSRLQTLGLKNEEISRLVSSYDVATLEAAATATEARLRRTDLDPVANRAAYFADALRRFRSHAVDDSLGEQSDSGASRQTIGVELLDAERPRKGSARKQRQEWSDVEERFRAFPKDEREALIKRFAEEIDNAAVLGEIARNGIAGPVVRAVFVPWLRREID